MNRFINLAILRNPLNWVTIGAMIILVIAAGVVIYSRISPSDSVNTATNLAKEA